MANGPNSRAVEGNIAELDDPAQRQAGWGAKHKWILWTIASSASFAREVSMKTLVTVLSVPVTAFVTANAGLLWDVALNYGGPFATWFAAIMGPIYLALGVKQSIVDRMKKPKP